MPSYDVICFSHLRWDFVFQRPQHLMTRCARARRVFFVQEPVFDEACQAPSLSIDRRTENLRIVTPRLPAGFAADRVECVQRALVDELMLRGRVDAHVLWYYTPMALGFTSHLRPLATVYDCMDELSAFRFAPAVIKEREGALFERASIVFTGGQSLYESKRTRHANVHAFPSSVDVSHFAQARRLQMSEPPDQAVIARPRFGFYGVIDERFDVELLDGIAALRPQWQFVMIGPVVKIDPSILPRRANIHWLGQRTYDELPRYLAGWDAALLLFARNEATRYISPTKTPEYLAAGRPVVSTSIHDVVHPYATAGLVRVADEAPDFVRAVEEAIGDDPDRLRERTDAFLGATSWDATWRAMEAHLDAAVLSTRAEQLISVSREEGVGSRV